MSKDQLYTLRWSAMQIARISTDPRINELAIHQIGIISQLLDAPIPEEFSQAKPVHPDVAPEKSPSSEKTAAPNEKKLWYPKAVIREDLKRPAKGEYPKFYPYGAIVHFTAGRYTKGVEDAIHTISDSNYFFCCIGIDGKFVQVNPLNQWGYHAGESAWTIAGAKRNGVSNHLVGIEINNPGRLQPHEGKYFTYWNWDDKTKKPKNPGDFIAADKVRVIKNNQENILAGAYLPYTKAQEDTLIDFLLWAKSNNPDVFNFDYVLGHDEVAGPQGIGYWRKNDPGGALSMTMVQFRQLLKDEYAKRYQ